MMLNSSYTNGSSTPELLRLWNRLSTMKPFRVQAKLLKSDNFKRFVKGAMEEIQKEADLKGADEWMEEFFDWDKYEKDYQEGVKQEEHHQDEDIKTEDVEY